MNKKLINLFEYINIIFMATVLIVSVTGTYSHIAWYKVSFVSAMWMVCFFVAYCVLKKMEAFLTRNANRILIIYFFVFFLALSVFSIICANTPNNDYGQVFADSKALLTNGEVYWQYYAIFKNNYLLLLIMAALRFPAVMLGFEGFHTTIVFSALCVALTALLIFKILNYYKVPISVCFLSLIVYSLFLPIWGNTYALYSDQATILLSLLPFYLVAVDTTEKKSNMVARCIFAGFFACIAFWLKATAIIPLIACLITVILTSFKKNVKKILITFASFIICMLCFELVWQQSPASKMTDLHMPVIYWVALGSAGDGGYNDNIDYVHTVINTMTVEAKTEYSVSYMKAHLDEMFSVNHIVSKMRHNFAAGFMGLSTYIHDDASPAFPFLSAYGRYGGYMMMLATGMYYLLLLLDIIGSVFVLISKQRKPVHNFALISELAIFGLFLFLMFWEANNRQLYNHIPWFVVSGMTVITLLIQQRKRAYS